jgi:DnaJ-class molecular chaperone
MPVATVPDYYEVLGVSPDASTEEIRKAYLKLAHKYHPDKTGGDKAAEEKLKKINEAYDILKNPEKRRQYDEMRKMAQSGFSFEDAGFDFSRFGAEDSPFADLFEAFFAHRRPSAARQQRQRGADIEAQVQITLREAAEGTQRVVRYLRNDTCDACHGTGSADGQGPMTCPECHGAGEVTERRGVFSITQTCTRCAGTGKVLTSPCSTCHGTGTVRKPREVRVDIPAGVQDGMRLRLAGQGEGRARCHDTCAHASRRRRTQDSCRYSERHDVAYARARLPASGRHRKRRPISQNTCGGSGVADAQAAQVIGRISADEWRKNTLSSASPIFRLAEKLVPRRISGYPARVRK